MKPSRSLLADVVSVVLAVCALVAVGILVRREFFPARETLAAQGSVPSREIEDFEAVSGVGQRIGPQDGQVVLVVFGDFECPVCRSFETGPLKSARARYPADLRVVFRHWPLKYHRFAYPAARAAECAAEQGRFTAFHDLLYAKQDSLGLKPFLAMAIESGVTDTLAFLKCNQSSAPVPSIERDIAEANRLKMAGTPTVIVNGTLLGFLPDSAGLDSLIRTKLDGKVK